VEQFNVSNEDGTRDAGGTVLYWAQRRLAVASIIRQAHPDILAVEEAAEWVQEPKGPRVADDIASMLGSPYTLAGTEIPPGQPGWFRTGDYLIYNSGSYAPLAAGGHWSVGAASSPAFEVYQLLRNRTSGARVLVIGTHLSGTSGGTGDDLRRTETERVIANAQHYAAAHGHPPIIYVGDFNSNDGRNHTFDGPGVATRAAQLADAFKSAQVLRNARYDSANNYYRTPPAFGRSIDRLFASPGVAIAAWRQYLNLSAGKFVGVIPSDHNPVAGDFLLPY
jgi:endonuclease/exonuclease/phosphatase family metal-dependent hydrolase